MNKIIIIITDLEKEEWKNFSSKFSDKYIGSIDLTNDDRKILQASKTGYPVYRFQPRDDVALFLMMQKADSNEEHMEAIMQSLNDLDASGKIAILSHGSGGSLDPAILKNNAKVAYYREFHHIKEDLLWIKIEEFFKQTQNTLAFDFLWDSITTSDMTTENEISKTRAAIKHKGLNLAHNIGAILKLPDLSECREQLLEKGKNVLRWITEEVDQFVAMNTWPDIATPLSHIKAYISEANRESCSQENLRSFFLNISRLIEDACSNPGNSPGSMIIAPKDMSETVHKPADISLKGQLQRTVLFLDDELGIWIEDMKNCLGPFGFSVKGESDTSDILQKMAQYKPDVVLLDVFFNGENLGKEAFLKIRHEYPNTPVVIISSDMDKERYQSRDFAGADGYFFKGMDYSSLADVLSNAVEIRKNQNTSSLYIKLKEGDYFIGKTPQMKKLLKEVEKVAPSNTTVLITGETGTGKEMLAIAIHEFSKRKKNLVTVNCSAIAKSLIESELFGHEKGAFTGAIRRKKGQFELANGGSIFLDEIGELELDMQAKILRVIQDKKVIPVGSDEEKVPPLDIRIIAATNRHLRKEVLKGNFREDLYQRLAVYPLELPPLRQRKEDISELSIHFVKKCSEKHNKLIVPLLRSDILEKLEDQPWVGNIRELENTIERAIVNTSHQVLQLEDFDFEVMSSNENTAPDPIKTIVDKIWTKRLTWNEIPNSLKRDVLARSIEKWKKEQGKRPRQRDLATLFNITTGNVGKILHNEGLNLKDWD